MDSLAQILEERPEDLAWIVFLLPLLPVLLITLLTRREPRVSGYIAICAVGLSFLVSIGLYMFVQRTGVSYVPATPWDWLQVERTENTPGLLIQMAPFLDPLSLLMLLVVTGVSTVIHIYSYGYMRVDPGLSRYFACLSLFTFAMLGIVLANNFIMMFIFWELVGVSSYLLIGFWHERPAAADAARKAFLTNRLGDFGFLLGILLLWWTTKGRTEFLDLQDWLAVNSLGKLTGLVGLLIFCGAVGKSAQFPLHVWLPDAMEGPTPVSALIHAATMVAAGVYMLCRVFFVFTAPAAWPAPLAFLHGHSPLEIIAWVGGITALLAALIATQQNDIKRILAYSTLSQLGYMIMAVGLSTAKQGPTPAMFHLVTHAFFKALLFLGAGSIILALHHEQSIWKMGGLRKKMPVTYWTFLIGALALCGLPPFSGFYSKDSILALAFARHKPLFGLAVATAALTAFYMFRLFFVALAGSAKSEAAGHARESKAGMALPLVALAVGSLAGGLVGLDRILDKVLAPRLAAPPVVSWSQLVLEPFRHTPQAACAGLVALWVGFTLAFVLYWTARTDPLPGKLGFLARALANRLYFDEVYAFLIRYTHEALAQLADWLDRWIIGGVGVKGVSGGVGLLGRGLRLLQTGNLQTYAFLFATGLAVLLWWVLR
jgi:NADH-quinone oxidoreductase subunit L